ncbi:hypothetical protein LAZ67_X003570 [Cordylochernes scorpioides]|uniref:Uncharacterized protein n=1 Tax=Cordylochernes scorpioides TaxID=51811 RepID=A0ABY6LWR6_9ARAC|nr:hypothetical protein LAZ67_X003570 [Cordylochernes scorpioides]
MLAEAPVIWKSVKHTVKEFSTMEAEYVALLKTFKVMPFGLCNAPATFEHLRATAARNSLEHMPEDSKSKIEVETNQMLTLQRDSLLSEPCEFAPRNLHQSKPD